MPPPAPTSPPSAATSLPGVLLAFDTATPAVTVALVDPDSGAVLAERTELDARRAGELLAPSIEAVLAQAGVSRDRLTGVVVGVGPGPFTGLRVGVVTARVLGLALGVPVQGVCTLDALAAATGLREPFAVATDARRREVYWATYRPGADLPEPDGGPEVRRPSDVASEVPVAGAGPLLYAESFARAAEPQHPSAALLVRWVRGGGRTYDPVPLYLRRPDVAEPHAAKAVLR